MQQRLNSIDFLIGLFGYSRVRYSQEGYVLDAIMSALKDCGAEKYGENGMPTVFDNYYFRIRGRQVKLQVEDYGDIVLWGPKKLVQDLSSRISDKLSRIVK
jgi:hypothetical protein